MMRRTVARQRPHSEPAPHIFATSFVDRAPERIVSSTV
jgi:hypothetical protein